jgi:hypothetical protein
MFNTVGNRDDGSLPSKCPIGPKNPPIPENIHYLPTKPNRAFLIIKWSGAE